MDLVFLNGLPIEIKKSKSGFWKNDLVIIHDPLGGQIAEHEVLVLMQYLYEEGFIEDRKTPYQIETR